MALAKKGAQRTEVPETINLKCWFKHHLRNVDLYRKEKLRKIELPTKPAAHDNNRHKAIIMATSKFIHTLKLACNDAAFAVVLVVPGGDGATGFTPIKNWHTPTDGSVVTT